MLNQSSIYLLNFNKLLRIIPRLKKYSLWTLVIIRGSQCSQLEIYTIVGYLHINATNCSIVILEKIIKRFSLNIYILNFESLLGPQHLTGVHNFFNLKFSQNNTIYKDFFMTRILSLRVRNYLPFENVFAFSQKKMWTVYTQTIRRTTGNQKSSLEPSGYFPYIFLC